MLTDVIHEFFGPRGARIVTLLAAGMALYVYLMLQLMIGLPSAEQTFIPQPVFVGAFGMSSRLLAASLTANNTRLGVETLMMIRIQRPVRRS